MKFNNVRFKAIVTRKFGALNEVKHSSIGYRPTGLNNRFFPLDLDPLDSSTGGVDETHAKTKKLFSGCWFLIAV